VGGRHRLGRAGEDEAVERGAGRERRLIGQQVVQDGTQGVDVRCRADRRTSTGGLLGGHVAGRAQNDARLRQRIPCSAFRVGLDPLHQSEVGHPRSAIGGQQHIGRFEVAVDDAARVGVMDGPGELLHEPGRVLSPSC
jgi:hypothetical protein